MQKWEYKDILVYDPKEPFVSLDGGKIPIKVAGKKTKYGPRLRDYLRYLGDEGWEITGTLTNRNDNLILLKRPLEE